MSKVKYFLFFTLLFCLSTLSFGQTQITTGVIQGTIADSTGALVSGATVEVKNINTNATRTVSTQADGRFTFLGLTPGNYKIKASKSGFTTLVQENVELTVGQAVNLSFGMKVSGTSEVVTVTGTPTVDVQKTESSSTLNARTVENIPVLGRKFEDLLTLTPGVSITQGPDGDEINFAGQRGIFNNVSLDGGDYNNGFFAEQLGGQRAAVDITLDAVQEFQVIANSASAEFGRTAGGVINVITKSGTNDLHGSLFHFQRLEALSSATSTGEPLKDFHREQFGGTVGGPIIKDKMFFFGAFEQIIGNLTRANLSAQTGPTACPISGAVVSSAANDPVINANADCQRLALINFMQTKLSQAEGLPVKHPIRNSAALAKYDWNVNNANKLSASFNYDYSKNENQTFDVPTYGNSANGTEGPSKIQAYNINLFTTIKGSQLNEAHFSYNREGRPRAATKSNVPADTAMGFGPTFRFGNPFFVQPGVDETFWRTQIKDNYSVIAGKHTVKFGGDWLHSNNSQVFRGFFTGRYLFDSVTGFLHYASPDGSGTGPTAFHCSDGSFGSTGVVPRACPVPTTVGGSPLLLYLQNASNSGPTTDANGAAAFSNENFALFIQDKWQIRRDFTLNIGLRWEAQIFPNTFIAPSQTAYGFYLNNPAFPSDGTLHSDKKMIQPRIGFAWDIGNKQKSVLRASWGIYNATQNMLTQTGPLTTNGVQLQSLASGSCGPSCFFGTAPVWPKPLSPAGVPAGTFPDGTGVTVFDKNYRNPRVYATNVAFEQELAPSWTAYADFTWNKSVYLTRFVDANAPGNLASTSLPIGQCPNGTLACGDTVSYGGAKPFATAGHVLGGVTNTESSAKSLYRGVTFGIRKKYSHGFQMEGNYVYSTDYDDDSNERDPFTFRYFNRFDFSKDYAPSDRDIRHKFNYYISANKLPAGFEGNLRLQLHSAQPTTDNFTLVPTGAPCSSTNSNTRVVNGIDCGRNHLRKDNAYSSVDWRLSRPFHFGDRYALIPTFEMFNTFNSANNVNSLASPLLFNFDGFLRNGAGDPRQAQLAVRFTF